LILTSMCDRLNPKELQDAGVQGWLVKPVKQRQLLSSLLRVFAGNSINEISGKKTTRDRQGDRREKILLAEDNVVNQKVALKQLQKLGFKADVAGNGLEVLDAVQKIPYDIIFMDCMMPEMDGYEATRKIRAMSGGIASLPIVAMTANAMQGDREKCLEAGMNDYIGKPVRIEELKSALERHLKSS
jgi:CheY-like chemotaxis protein